MLCLDWDRLPLYLPGGSPQDLLGWDGMGVCTQEVCVASLLG